MYLCCCGHFGQGTQAAAVDAALKLSRLWNTSKNAEMLQHPPPAIISKHTARLFQETHSHIAALDSSLPDYPAEPKAAVGFLEAVMPYKPVLMLARLAAWLQYNPELLQLTELATDMGSLPASSPGRLWLDSTETICLLDNFAADTEDVHIGYDMEFEMQLEKAGKQQVH